MECQVGGLPGAGTELSRIDRIRLRLQQLLGFLRRGTRKVSSDPASLVRRAAAAAGVPASADCQVSIENGTTPSRPEALGLQVGERVRVKSWDDIKRTLDADERCGGLGWMSLQQQFCGREFTVVKRIERFFDERARRLLKVRDIVYLDGVHCMPPKDGPWGYAGCDRMCFLFWKEAWLERVPAGKEPGSDVRA